MSNPAKQLLTQTDPVLAKIIHSIPEPVHNSTQDVFFDLMSCILEQQIHYRSSKKIFQKMLDAAQLTHLSPENFAQLEEKAFATAKLSMGKYETLGHILSFWQQNQIDWQTLSDEAVRAQLGSIKGIGPWTIDMILLYTLERPNIFPVDDFHLKQIMVSQYGLNPESKLKAQMLDIANDWGENRSLAVRYLLAWKEFGKKKPV
jgi:DNA-3-methyladenine glycosylase II